MPGPTRLKGQVVPLVRVKRDVQVGVLDIELHQPVALPHKRPNSPQVLKLEVRGARQSLTDRQLMIGGTFSPCLTVKKWDITGRGWGNLTMSSFSAIRSSVDSLLFLFSEAMSLKLIGSQISQVLVMRASTSPGSGCSFHLVKIGIVFPKTFIPYSEF